MEGPLVLFLGSKVAAKYSVFVIELRALALAVLAVQVCCRARGMLQFLQRSRIDRFVAGACSRQGLTALPYEYAAAQA